MSATSGKHVANLAREVVAGTTGVKFKILTGSSAQDCAALSVAEELDLEPDKCTMH